MNDRHNTIAGWVLFAGIVALGSSIVSSEVFNSHRPETMGYPIEGVEVEGEGAEAAKPIEFYLAAADPTKGEQVFKKCAACHNADQGGANALGPGAVRRPWASRSARAIGFAYLRRAEGQGRHLGLGQDVDLAGQPEEVRARHQDDLRRARQSRGPRQRHAFLNQQGRMRRAAARRLRPRDAAARR